jgi:hypothetical protein
VATAEKSTPFGVAGESCLRDTTIESGLTTWSIFSGTIVNVVTVAFGSLLGLSISGSLPDRYRTIVLQALGLITITLGIEPLLRFSERLLAAPLVQRQDLRARWRCDDRIAAHRRSSERCFPERIESAGAWIHGLFGQDGPSVRGRPSPPASSLRRAADSLGCLETRHSN